LNRQRASSVPFQEMTPYAINHSEKKGIFNLGKQIKSEGSGWVSIFFTICKEKLSGSDFF
jgi:hypothetical protein